MAKRRIRREAIPQTPKERLIEGNVRVVSPSGRTTWKVKA